MYSHDPQPPGRPRLHGRRRPRGDRRHRRPLAEPGPGGGRPHARRSAPSARRRPLRDGIRREALHREPVLRPLRLAAWHEPGSAAGARGEDGDQPRPRRGPDRDGGDERDGRRLHGPGPGDGPLRPLQARPHAGDRGQGGRVQPRRRHRVRLQAGDDTADGDRVPRRGHAAVRPEGARRGRGLEPHPRRGPVQEERRPDGAGREGAARLHLLDGGGPEPARRDADLGSRARGLRRTARRSACPR